MESFKFYMVFNIRSAEDRVKFSFAVLGKRDGLSIRVFAEMLIFFLPGPARHRPFDGDGNAVFSIILINCL